jgi:hypothetical protein
VRLPRRSKDPSARKNFEWLEQGLYWDFNTNDTPGIPETFGLRVFCRLNGSSKKQLVVKDELGNESILWTQP